MSRALQIYYSSFDEVFLSLPDEVRRRMETALDDMGRRLRTFPHYRLAGTNRYRLRVGEYRIIYTFDNSRNEIHLLAAGHRRDIYRWTLPPRGRPHARRRRHRRALDR